ncbi:uncharacterized protein [Panulirus ornatus]|uniref:uncharacterized protein n=1 Tax=Panulirus ornatus TaxID=150431 RepID=UPI003A84D02D
MHRLTVSVWWVFLAVLASPGSAWAQMGLRSAPLTVPREGIINNGGSLGIFSKWSGLGSQNKSNTKSIESSLAAIFRGVAYGISTTPTSTTSTTPPPTTVPTAAPTTRSVGQGRHHPPPFSSPEWSGLEELLLQTFEDGSLDGFPEMLPDGSNEMGDVVEANGGVEVSREAWVRTLGVAWVVHVYCAAGLYSLLAVLALLWLSRVHAAPRLLPPGYYITFHLLMLFVAFLRCVHLFHDPYGAKHKLPEAMAVVVAEVGWPCLTGAIALVVMAVVHAWRFPPHVPLRHNAPVTLGIITVFHLLVSICTHLFAVVFPEHSGPLRAASRAATAAWGGVIGVGSFVAICRVAQAAQQRHGHHTVMVSRAPAGSTAHHPRTVLVQAAHLTLVATFAQVVLAALHMYGLLGPHYVLQLPPSQPWHWLAFQSTCCLVEILAWVLLAVVSLLTVGGSPVKRRARKGEAKLFSVLWCNHCKSCVNRGGRENDVFHSVCHSSTQPVTSYTLQTCAKTMPHEVLRHPHPPRHVPPSLRKPPSFRPPASDVHLLWSHGHTQDAPPSGCSSRPSSMVLSGTGLGRFKKQMNPQTGMSEVCQQSLQSKEAQMGTKESSFLQKAAGEETSAYDQPLYYSVAKTSDSSPVKSITSPKFGSPYPDNRLEHLLQNNPISAEMDSAASEDGQSRSEGVSMTDYSSTDALSLAVMGDNDCSKYTSTCSSISAANSFDVRMCDDFEVGYYQIPYSASPHVYPAVHQQSPLGQSVHHGVVQETTVGAPQGSEPRRMEQVRSLQDSRTSSPASDPNSDHAARHPHHLQTRKSHPDLVTAHPRVQREIRWESSGAQWSPCVHRSLNIQNIQGDSVVLKQGAGHTDEAIAEADGKLVEVIQPHQSPHLSSGRVSNVVKANVSQIGCGMVTSDNEGVYAQPQKCHRAQQTHHRRRSTKGERVRPCGHRPRHKQEPASAAVQAQDKPQDDPQQQQQQLEDDRDKGGLPTADGTTQTDVNTLASTSSSRAGSSLDSDLPSDGVDSESEVPFEVREYHVEDKRKIGVPPELPPRKHDLQRPTTVHGHNL